MCEQEGDVSKDENEGEEEEGEQNKEGAPSLHLFDCKVQGEQKADSQHSAQLLGGCPSCFEAEVPPYHQAHCPE